MPKLCLFLAIATGTALAATTAPAQVHTVETQSGEVEVETVAAGLDQPWGMAFLPDGRMLVTEISGNLRIVSDDGSVSEPLEGTPDVFAQGQGGLLDVAIDPDFASNGLVYLSFAEAGDGGASTALGRGRLADDRIEGFEVIFRQEPRIDGDKHFGSRIVLSPDGTIFLTLGERFQFAPAQDLSNHLGAIVRINPDGSVPQDNPFVDRDNARGEIWSYGHRNIEAAAIHPETGYLWIAEMGPQGGDEINLIEPGANYGWPQVSWGEHYTGEDIPDPPTEPRFADAAAHWTPVISPSGMVFYTGDLFPEWQGDALIGGLSGEALIRVGVDGTKAVEEERIALGARIREVEQGPDGAVYVLTDQADGNVLRIRPRASAGG
jgi:glucose/arabinose dehydrogenase